MALFKHEGLFTLLFYTIYDQSQSGYQHFNLTITFASVFFLLLMTLQKVAFSNSAQYSSRSKEFVRCTTGDIQYYRIAIESTV